MKGQQLGGGIAFSHGEACRVNRVTFFNGAGTKEGVTISSFFLDTTNAPIVLKGDIGVTSQFIFDGYPFSSGFTCTPSNASVTNIVIEYEQGLA